MGARTFGIALLVAATGAAAGCGSSSPPPHTTSAGRSTTTSARASSERASSARTTSHAARPAAVALRPAETLGALPEARSGIAAATVGASIVVSGGLSPAGTSTDTVYRLPTGGTSSSAAVLPGPVHDAAATAVAGRLLLFGGGRFEGSNRIVSVLPGPPRTIGTLPQALSDLDAVTIGPLAYVLGGWNGVTTNAQIYAVTPSGRASRVGRLRLGVRYPAAAALGNRLIVAGGETTSGAPTRQAWSFDPTTSRIARLPDLPVATDHAAAATLAGRVYVLGRLRDGAFTDAIVSWSPGERSWHRAGHLPSAQADFGAVSFDGGIVTIGGRDSGGKLAAVRLLRSVPPR